MPQVHKRTCHICEANCGLLIAMDGEEIVSIKGNPDHVLSRGHICPKGTAIADLQTDPDRLRGPVKKLADGGWQAISWDQALAQIGGRFAAIAQDGGKPALYMGNPSAHDYGISTQAGQLRRALGIRNIYSASTLDQIPHHRVQYEMYGHVSLAPVPDIDRCMNLVIIGGNPAASNGSIWTVPDFKKRVREMQMRGGTLTVIDPRQSETALLADTHHFIRPGSDTALLLALLKMLFDEGLVDPAPVAELLDDSWERLSAALAQFAIADLSAHCAIAPEAIADLARSLVITRPAALYGRMGVSVTEYGTLNQWLIQLINIASGNLNREGGTLVPEPVLDTIALVGRGSFRQVATSRGEMPAVMGELPMVTFAEEMLREDAERIRTLFVVTGNPVLSAPDGARLDRALAGLDLMVSIDMYVTETSRHADYILPPCGPLSKDHYPLFFGPLAVRNFGCYSPAILPVPDGEKTDWEIVAELAGALIQAQGQERPNVREPREALDQMLRSSPAALTLADLEAAPDGIDLGPLRPALAERLKTESGLIHAAPQDFLDELARFAASLSEQSAHDLLLIGRRHIRSNNSWLHNSRRLLKGPDRCTLLIHPDDAAQRGLGDGDLALVTSAVNSVTIPVEVSPTMMPGAVSIPHGFGHGRGGVQLSVAAAKPGVSINDLTDPARYDRLSGNAVLNATPVTVVRHEAMEAAE
jgi:anaerobic selenocysteine-containing dehydrogenase